MTNSFDPKSNPEDFIKNHGFELGFDQVGITNPDGIGPAGDHFQKFLNQDWHGDMTWLKEKAERRVHPKALWPDTNSIIMMTMNYGTEANPLANLENKSIGNISTYARGKDYHDVFKKRIKQLARNIHGTFGVEVKVFVDTAPVMEKPLAASAGIGWQGKHTNLVSRKQGSWFFLGAIFTDLKLNIDLPHEERCGTCRACLDVCPTNAFPEPFKLDARKCISYLTIEYKGHIEEAYRGAMGNRIYGCDDCLAACPWNRFAIEAHEAAYFSKDHLQKPNLKDLITLDDPAFREFFKGSPIKRTGRNRFIRNVLIAVGNSGNKDLIPECKKLLNDESPLVRAMAVWALTQLETKDGLKKLFETHEPDEDPEVESEWVKAIKAVA